MNLICLYNPKRSILIYICLYGSLSVVYGIVLYFSNRYKKQMHKYHLSSYSKTNKPSGQ